MNLKVRVKNPVFWVQIVLSILTPVLAYAGLTAQDLTTWSKVGELIVGAISNPYGACEGRNPGKRDFYNQ